MSTTNQKSGIGSSKATDQLANRNTEHEKLETFKDNLKTTYDELVSKKDTINYYDFSYSLLKDGGVKSKIIKSICHSSTSRSIVTCR